MIIIIRKRVRALFFYYRYRTMAKTLTCDYTLDLPNFEHISHHGKDFISKLLVLDPKVDPSPGVIIFTLSNRRSWENRKYLSFFFGNGKGKQYFKKYINFFNLIHKRPFFRVRNV